MSRKAEVVEFILLVAQALHRYGAAAHHIEAALQGLANRYCDGGEFFVSPTAIITSFNFEGEWISRLQRVQPGGINLGKLSEVDRIGDQVIHGQMGMQEGIKQIQEVANKKHSKGYQAILGFCFVIASAGFCGFFKGSWPEMMATGILAFVSWIILEYSGRTGMFKQMPEFIVALFVSLMSYGIFVFEPSVKPEKIALSSLIVLIPGLSITVALSEIATKNWLAGTARLAGASAELIKMTFGVVLGTIISQNVYHLPPSIYQPLDQLVLPEILLLIPSGLAFAILFDNQKKDYIWVTVGACLSFYAAKYGGLLFNPQLGVFWGGAVLAAYSNTFARLLQRPALTVLLPGLIPMVPGSIGFKSVALLFNHEITATMTSVFNLIIVAVALVAGLTMGNLIVHPRRSI